MKESTTPRRQLLKVLAGGLGGFCAAACVGGGGGGSSPNSGTLSGGNASSIGMDTLTALDGEGVALGRDSAGIYAVSLICTHEQCDMSTDGTVSARGIYCNCHGASFDRNGAVTGGPANGPLDHYAVSVDASGAITIDFDTAVTPATRTPVPG